MEKYKAFNRSKTHDIKNIMYVVGKKEKSRISQNTMASLIRSQR